VNELFMIAGPAGSGKTTTGRALAERLGARVVDLDDVTADLVGGFLAANPGQDEAAALHELRELRYAELAAETRRLLVDGSGLDVVAIAPFTAEISSQQRWDGWVDAVGVPGDRVHLVWLTLPPAERLRRMAARAASRDATLLAGADAGQAVPEATGPVVPCRTLDALLPVADQVYAVIATFR
jgi:mannitol-1-/sugar-/sorbitol-6-phosphatase